MAENVKITISAIDKTKRGFNSVTSGLKTLTKAVFNMKTALGLAAGAAGLGLLAKKSIDAIDSLEKTASKIGTTTQSLSKLHFAADITGVSVETLNMASQRFTRRLAEAAKGTGEAKNALKELGINAEELKKKELDEQMLDLADAFSTVKSQADRVRLAMKLFDSEGVSLVNTLNLGRVGLQEMFKEAETLGLVLSSRAVGGIVRTRDAMTKLFSLFKGVRDQITGALAPAFETLANTLREKILAAIEAADGSIEKFANQTIKNLIKGFGEFIRAIAFGLETVIDGLNKFVEGLTRVGHYIDENIKIQKDFFDKTFLNSLYDAGNGIIRFAEGSAFAFGEMKKGKKPLEEQIVLFDRLQAAFKDVEDLFPTLDEGMQKVAKSMSGAITKGFTDAITGAEKFSDAMKAMAKSVVDSLIEMLVQYYITQSLFGLITGTAFPGSTQTPAPITDAVGTMPSINPSASSIAPKFEGGGFTGYGSRSGGVDGKGGFPAILHPNETVIDHTKGQSSGVVVQQTINVTTGVQQTVRAEIVQLMPQIAQAAKGAVADARLRGGNFSKAMAGA